MSGGVHACATGDLATMRQFIARGTDVNMPEAKHYNPLAVALDNNQIEDITPLLGLKNLKSIWIKKNPVCEDAEQMQMLREAFPDAEIDYFDNPTKRMAE